MMGFIYGIRAVIGLSVAAAFIVVLRTYLSDEKRCWLDNAQHQNKLGWAFWRSVFDDWIGEPLNWFLGLD
jgi:hypothetical protein